MNQTLLSGKLMVLGSAAGSNMHDSAAFAGLDGIPGDDAMSVGGVGPLLSQLLIGNRRSAGNLLCGQFIEWAVIFPADELRTF